MNDYNPYPRPPASSVQFAPQPPKGSNGLAIAGFVLGLLGFLGSWIPVINVVGIILGVIGVVLAGVGLSKSRSIGSGRGLAIAGLILGVLAIAIAIFINVVFVGAVVDAVDDAVDEVTESSVSAPDGSTYSDLGSSRDNPAPIGSTVTSDDWKVVINSVSTVKKDQFGSRAAAGKVLLVVDMTATYIGDNEQGETVWSDVNVVTADGESISSGDGSTLFVATDEFDSLKTVYPGRSVTGSQIFEVPADGWDNGGLAVSPGIISDDVFVALK